MKKAMVSTARSNEGSQIRKTPPPATEADNGANGEMEMTELKLASLGQAISPDPYWEAERKRWLADPFTTGVVVRHKASGITMVVTGRPLSYPKSDRTCAWMADNRRYEEDFMLCELERAEPIVAASYDQSQNAADAP